MKNKKISAPSSRSSKKTYKQPVFRVYGSVMQLTLGGGTQGAEGMSGMGSFSSDIRMKENITRIGRHSFGFSLYLFDYKLKFRNICGHGRQFGVMADEVEKIVPEAVTIGSDGYKRVNYTMLGINRNIH